MKIRLLPDGRPGQHLGISHTLKHYLDPREMWQDIAGDIAPAQQPLQILAKLPPLSTPPHEQHRTPEPALSSSWEPLRSVYRRGYGLLITQGLDRMPAPDVEPSQWVRHDQRCSTALPGGVIVSLIRRGDTWNLYTSFRNVNFRLLRYDCPPRDAENVSRRRALAEIQARRWLALKRAQEKS